MKLILSPLGSPPDEGVDYLAHMICSYDVVLVSARVDDITPALNKLHWFPPLVGYRDLNTQSRQDEQAVAVQWRAIFHSALSEAAAAQQTSIFASLVQGGFECSTHKRADERRLDLLAATGHDLNTKADFRQLQEYGIRTVRDGLRWHLIETGGGQYDWSSFLPMFYGQRVRLGQRPSGI